MRGGTGFFAVLEGPEGSGKTTLAARLVQRAEAAGIEVVAVREPGGTAIAEAAREAVLLAHGEMAPETELFLFLAARSDLMRRVIRPALEAGRFVLADRFELSTMAYQVAGRGLDPAMVEAANRAATGGIRPDLTLVLDVPVEVGAARQVAAGKMRDRLDKESHAFHARVAAAYLAAQGEGVRHLDGTLAPDRLAEAAWAELVRSRPERFARG
jgi:dTMP kinase